jgi:hypothetical protein
MLSMLRARLGFNDLERDAPAVGFLSKQGVRESCTVPEIIYVCAHCASNTRTYTVHSRPLRQDGVAQVGQLRHPITLSLCD